MVADESDARVITEFLERIWKDDKAYVYIALRHPETLTWKQEFFEWPYEGPKLVQFILKRRSAYEVYFGPSLFSERNSEKTSVIGSHVYWIEYDGKPSVHTTEVPEPSIVVQTSDETHRHIYWCCDELIEPQQLEAVNRSLTYLLDADSSGWDCNQVLRIPCTFNHKKSRDVILKHTSDHFVTSLSFKAIPPAPPLELEVPDELPDVEEVITKYQYKSNVYSLFKDGVPVGSRSDGLMALGYHLAEMNLTNSEMLAMLVNADERWGKFAKRQDQLKRLMEIVVRARLKYPFKNEPDKPDQRFIYMGTKEILNAEVNLEWVWEGLLHKQGYFLLTGPTGVGKTQFSTAFGFALARGKDFLGRHIPNPAKFGFFSLEMGLVEVKELFRKQTANMSPEDLELLQENFKTFPLGEPIYLSKDLERQKVEKAIEEYGLEGLIIDSLGSVTEDELSGEAQVKVLLDWVDHVRQTYDCFIWLLHHHRKAQAANKKPNKLSDVYGNQYITARATSVLALWDIGQQNTIECIPLKIRLAPKENPFYIYRDADLNFFEKKGYVPKVIDLSESNNKSLTATSPSGILQEDTTDFKEM